MGFFVVKTTLNQRFLIIPQIAPVVNAQNDIFYHFPIYIDMITVRISKNEKFIRRKSPMYCFVRFG